MDDFAFETNDDVMDAPGRVVQPGAFTLSVESQRARVRFLGNPSDESQWLVLSRHGQPQ